MADPVIWQSPTANQIFRNIDRSYADGDSISIPFTFNPLRTITKVRYIKGALPYGTHTFLDGDGATVVVNSLLASASGISGTLASEDGVTPTPPRDYTITVRAFALATQEELEAGLPAEVFEDQTFTIVGGLWETPSAGELRNGLIPYRRSDSVNIQLGFDIGRTIQRVDLIGGDLPPGLAYNSATYRILGQIDALPKNRTEYPVLFRAYIGSGSNEQFQDRSFKFIVDPLDELHGWNSAWISTLPTTVNVATNETIYQLGTVFRGGAVQINLQILNPDNDPLTFKATGYVYNSGTWFEGLPKGLRIDDTGRIIGTPEIAINIPGDYYFRVYAREPSGTEGTPRTSELIFSLTLSPEIRIDQQLNDRVKWITPPGSLGSTYETYPSHFTVEAEPLFELSSLLNEFQVIDYQVVGGSLPPGSFLNSATGEISGRFNYVDSDRTWQFTVRARVVFINRTTGAVRSSSNFSDRAFSITILNLALINTGTDLYIHVSPFDREEIARWVYGTNPEYRDPDPRAPDILTVLGRDVLFRRNDPDWGKVETPKILLVAGLLTDSTGDLMTKLRDYHHPTELRINELKWARGVDPSGVHIYDMLYLSIIDPMEGAAGFDAFGGDVTIPFPSSANRLQIHEDGRASNYPPGTRAVPKMNLPANSDRYHPNSIENMRKDLTSRTNRRAWAANGETSSNRGIGLVGREPLPLWMTCEQVRGQPSSRIGYIPAIELAYLRPGQGPQAVRSLVQAGFQDRMQGRVIKVDRYVLFSNGLALATFDLDIDNGIITTFDGPDSDPPTAQFTTFDQTLLSTSKYYKFPPGDSN